MSASTAKGLWGRPARRRWPAFLQPLGLRARIALLVSSGLLALMTLFAVLGVAALRDSTERDFQARAMLAQTAASHLDSVLGQAATAAERAASELAPAIAAGDEGAADHLLRDAHRWLAVPAVGLVLFDAAGRVLRTELPPAALPYPRLSPEILGLLESGKPAGVDWVPAGGGGVALVVVPVVGPARQKGGFLAVALDFSEAAVGHWLRQMALGRSGQVDVVDGRGRVLITTAGDQPLQPEGHAGYLSGLMSRREPTVTTCYNCHASAEGPARRRDLMAFAPMPTAGWGLVLRQSEEEVLEPTRRLQQQILGLSLVSLPVALFVVWLTTRSLVGPVRSLTSSARRIAEGDLSEAVPVQGGDEIGELARALDYMRVRLQGSIEEVKGYNAELDRRVRERTEELEQSKDDLERSRDHLETLIERLSTLNAIAVALNRSLDLEAILGGALVNSLKLIGMDAGAVYLLNERSGELELAAHHGLSLEAARVAANLGLSASLSATVAQEDQILVVEDTSKYARGTRSVLRQENIRCLVRVPFKSAGALLGTMCLGSRTPRTLSMEEVNLLQSVSSQLAVAVQNARLYEELRRRERMRGELLQKVITAQEAERKRIARELHDQTSQALAALAVAVETAAGQAAEGGDVGASLGRMRSLAASTLEEVHRLIFDLRPTLLDDLGLIAALRWYAESRLAEVGIKVRLEVAGEERRLAPEVETALYRVVQEAVNNVCNHSGAQSFTVTLVLKHDSLSLAMVDDGWGFDMAELARSTDQKRGLGLMGMKERVELLGGTFALYSELGGGTKITVEVPLLEGEADGDE